MPIIPREQGRLFVETQAAAAAGAVLVYTVPARTRLRLHSLSFPITTDANVADRYVNIYCTTAVGVANQVLLDYAHVATTLMNYLVIGRLGCALYTIPGYTCAPLGLSWLLPPASTVRIGLINIQAGDVIGPAIISGESWIAP